MTRKLSITFTIILLFSLFFATPALAAKSYYAERFDVQIDIQENGSAIITETVEFHFSGDPFTFAFREISTSNGAKIIAAIRDAWKVNGQITSFVQMMGLPQEWLSTMFWFPAYNNVTLDGQLRFGVP